MPRVLTADDSVGKRSILWSLPWSKPQDAPLVFQSVGGANVNAPTPAGEVIVQTKSEVLACRKQTSSVADDTVRKLQFWLSQLTDMPATSLSGMARPDVDGCAAHNVEESHVSWTDGCWVTIEGELPPPPQLANNVVRESKIEVQ